MEGLAPDDEIGSMSPSVAQFAFSERKVSKFLSVGGLIDIEQYTSFRGSYETTIRFFMILCGLPEIDQFEHVVPAVPLKNCRESRMTRRVTPAPHVFA